MIHTIIFFTDQQSRMRVVRNNIFKFQIKLNLEWQINLYQDESLLTIDFQSRLEYYDVEQHKPLKTVLLFVHGIQMEKDFMQEE